MVVWSDPRRRCFWVWMRTSDGLSCATAAARSDVGVPEGARVGMHWGAKHVHTEVTCPVALTRRRRGLLCRALHCAPLATHCPTRVGGQSPDLRDASPD